MLGDCVVDHLLTLLVRDHSFQLRGNCPRPADGISAATWFK